MPSATKVVPASSRTPVRSDEALVPVLVVDPDLSARSVLRVALAREGFDVTAVSSAEEARSALGPGRPIPAAVVSEVDLPGMDGVTFCAELRRELRTSKVPVLLISRREDAELRAQVAASGADDCLAKPLFVMDVVSLLRLKTAPATGSGAVVLDTDVLPLRHLLRAMMAGLCQGRIELEEGAWVSLRQGRVVGAAHGPLHGLAALNRMLLLGEGPYSVMMGSIRGAATFTYGLRELVSTGFPNLRQFEQVVERSVPLDAVLAVDFASLATALPQLPDGVNAVVRLFDGHRSVREVLVDSSLSELLTLEITTRLFELEVIRPTTVPPLEGGNRPRPAWSKVVSEALSASTGLLGAVGRTAGRAAGRVERTMVDQLPHPQQHSRNAAFSGAERRSGVEPRIREEPSVGFDRRSGLEPRTLDGPSGFAARSQAVTLESAQERSSSMPAAATLMQVSADEGLTPVARSEPLPPEMTAELSPEFAQQLDAFNIRAVDEPATRPVEPAELERFVHTTEAVETPPVDQAFEALYRNLAEAGLDDPPVAFAEGQSMEGLAGRGPDGDVDAPFAEEQSVGNAPESDVHALTVEGSIEIASARGSDAFIAEYSVEGVHSGGLVQEPNASIAVEHSVGEETERSFDALEAEESIGRVSTREADSLPAEYADEGENVRGLAEDPFAAEESLEQVAGGGPGTLTAEGKLEPVSARGTDAFAAENAVERVTARSGPKTHEWESTFFVDESSVAGEVPRRSSRRLKALLVVAAVILVGSGIGLAIPRPSSAPSEPARLPVVVEAPRSPPPAAEVSPSPLPAAEPLPAAPPSTAPVLGLREGMSLYDSGKPQEAAGVLRKVVAEHPDSANAWLFLGLARFDSQDRLGAEQAALRTLELAPKSGRAVMLLATVYLDAGQKGKAAIELKRYLQLEPHGPFANDAKQLLAPR